MKRILIGGFVSVVITLVVVGAFPQGALACSCVLPEDRAEFFNNSDVVFTGTVTDIGNIFLKGFRDSSIEYPVYFEVQQPYKGLVQKRMKITTAQSEASCGDTFYSGQEYLVYAHKQDNGTLSTNVCSGNTFLGATIDYVWNLLLGANTGPISFTSETYKKNSVSSLFDELSYVYDTADPVVFWLVSIMAVLLVGLGVSLWQGRR